MAIRRSRSSSNIRVRILLSQNQQNNDSKVLLRYQKANRSSPQTWYTVNQLRLARETMNHQSERYRSWRVSLLLLLTAGASLALSFQLLGPGSRFLSVLYLQVVLGYLVGKLFMNDFHDSCALGWIFSLFGGVLYLTYLYPIIENDWHDLSSIMAGVGATVIYSSLVSSAFWLIGVLIRRRRYTS